MPSVISKKRSCTVRSETVDKVKELNRRMAEYCDRVLLKNAAKVERATRRASFKNKRREK